MSSITITRLVPMNGPPITCVAPNPGYPQQARADAAWAFQHLAEACLSEAISPDVVIRAEVALEGALDALAAVRKAESARGMHTSLAWRTADWWSRKAVPTIAAARADAEVLPPPAAARGAGR